MRQIMKQGLVLTAVGVVAGLAGAFGLNRLISSLLFGVQPTDRITMVAVVATITIVAAVACWVPAWRASRLDPNEVLKGAGPKSTVGRGERRLLRAVTTAQTALTLVLLVGAGLLIRTMINIANAPSGYDTSRILTMSVTSVEMSGGEFHRRALERVQALPGVQHAAYAWGVPLTGNNSPGRVIIEGQPVSRESE